MYEWPFSYQSTNSMPSLKLACVARMNSFSSIFIERLKSLMGGIVASPTPTMPISSDSTSSMEYGMPIDMRPSDAAVIHPAVPPPTTTILLTLRFIRASGAWARGGRAQAPYEFQVGGHRGRELLHVLAQRHDLLRRLFRQVQPHMHF